MWHYFVGYSNMDFIRRFHSDDPETLANLRYLNDEKDNGNTVDYTVLLWSLTVHDPSLVPLAQSKVETLAANVIHEFMHYYKELVKPVRHRIPSLADDRATYTRIPLRVREYVERTVGVYTHGYKTVTPPRGLTIALAFFQAYDAFDAGQYRKASQLFRFAAIHASNASVKRDFERFAKVSRAYYYDRVDCEYRLAWLLLDQARQLEWEEDQTWRDDLFFSITHTRKLLETDLPNDDKVPDDTLDVSLIVNPLSLYKFKDLTICQTQK